MEIGQIIHIILSVAAFIISLRALSDVRLLRKQLSDQQGAGHNRE